MKKYLVIMLVMGLQAVACPDLSGTYECYFKTSDGLEPYQMVVSQEEKGSDILFLMATENEVTEFLADGKWRQVEGANVGELYRASCALDDNKKVLSLWRKSSPDKNSKMDTRFVVSKERVKNQSLLKAVGLYSYESNGKIVNAGSLSETCKQLKLN